METMETTKDLNNYTRITSVLSFYSDFSNIDPVVLKNACDRGTRVHRFCELYAKNLLIEPVDDDCKPYFESFVKWFDSVVDYPIYTEQRIFCETHKITGQIDLILKLKGSDTICIVDLKTPQLESKTWRLQTSAYQYLVESEFDFDKTSRACLMLDRKGGIPKYKQYSSDEIDKILFFNALELYKFFKGK